MILAFYKYHGTGNDFILVDNRSYRWKPATEQVAFLCDRHFGIGADGLILLNEKEGFDFEMFFFNSDGKESTMCGNGGRCITAFAHKLSIIGADAKFFAIDGEHVSRILEHSNETIVVSLKMKDVVVDEIIADHHFMNTGSPHYVSFVKDVAGMDVVSKAHLIRYGERFSEEGTNIDFVEIQKDKLFVRTYERGVEDETLSCGTGVTAAALAVAIKNPDNPGYYRVLTKGGQLKVRFTQTGTSFTDIWLEGPAKFIYKGEVCI
ncbi:MAG: diaminopimelate epimerase [Bacteroidetes bacterium]|nr:diaminopimelate epimerase [Bacteroidota bacterium]